MKLSAEILFALITAEITVNVWTDSVFAMTDGAGRIAMSSVTRLACSVDCRVAVTAPHAMKAQS